MATHPLELTLELSARARFDVVEMRERISTEHGDALAAYPYCLYWSAHTTAGFLDRSLSGRLGPELISTYIDTLRRIFPEGAGYAHDWLERRDDLDPAQKAVEPRNGDSHLAFIAAHRSRRPPAGGRRSAASIWTASTGASRPSG